MILTGKEVLDLGIIKPPPGGTIDPEQVQPHGIDLRLETVYHTVVKPWPEKILPEDDFTVFPLSREEGCWIISPADWKNGVYQVKIAGSVDLRPRWIMRDGVNRLYNFCGLCRPRSSLTRRGIQIESSWWDSGYVGSGTMLLIANRDIRLRPGDRIAQMYIFEARPAQDQYNGQYQREGLRDVGDIRASGLP